MICDAFPKLTAMAATALLLFFQNALADGPDVGRDRHTHVHGEVRSASSSSAWSGGDIDADDATGLKDAILGLQLLGIIDPPGIAPKADIPDIDIDGDQAIGMAEVLFILAKTSGLRRTWYKDGDGDGYGDALARPLVTENRPAGYYLAGELMAAAADCADDAPEVYPGAIETCGDGIDQDCTGGDLACPSNPLAGGWDVAHTDDTGQGDWIGSIEIHGDFTVSGQPWHQAVSFAYTLNGRPGTVTGTITASPDGNDSHVAYENGAIIYTERGQASLAGVWAGGTSESVSGTALYELTVTGTVDDVASPSAFWHRCDPLHRFLRRFSRWISGRWQLRGKPGADRHGRGL